MKKLLVIPLLLVGLCLVGSLSATGSSAAADAAAAGNALVEELPDIALPWAVAFADPATESCSAALVLDDLTSAGSCVQENQVCRSPWFNGECCPGLHCTFLYPNVPWYCL